MNHGKAQNFLFYNQYEKGGGVPLTPRHAINFGGVIALHKLAPVTPSPPLETASPRDRFIRSIYIKQEMNFNGAAEDHLEFSKVGLGGGPPLYKPV